MKLHHSDFHSISPSNMEAMDRESQHDWIRKYNHRQHMQSLRNKHNRACLLDSILWTASLLLLLAVVNAPAIWNFFLSLSN